MNIGCLMNLTPEQITDLATKTAFAALSGTPTGGGSGPVLSKATIKRVESAIRRFLYKKEDKEKYHYPWEYVT
jgi:hypothetical protein